MELYLQQLAGLELLFSEVRAGVGTESQELEGRLLVAEETLRTILREAVSLQGTTRPPPLDGAIWAVSGRVLLPGPFCSALSFSSAFLFPSHQPPIGLWKAVWPG